MNPGLRPAVATTVGLTLGLLAACSAVPRVDAMVVDDVAVGANHAAMTVQVRSGAAFSVQGSVDCPPDLLGTALDASLRAATAIPAVSSGGGVLTVTLHHIGQTGGFDISVDMVTVWMTSDAPGWQYTAAGRGTASFGEAWWGWTRLRLATERAGQAMIRDGLQALRQRDGTASTR